MVSTFCFRLIAGLIGCIPFLPRDIVPPRFFRVHYLSAIGLLAVAAFFQDPAWDAIGWTIYGLAGVLCLLGSMSWHIDSAPGAAWLGYATPFALFALLLWPERSDPQLWRIADTLASAALLGAGTTSMLMGHSYLIAPSMSIAPLVRLLGLLGGSLAFRTVLACLGLWQFTSQPGGATWDGEAIFLFSVRWALGLIAPMFLAWMAGETARIRSTQSATGILYVVTIVVFLGELCALLLTTRLRQVV